MLVVVGYRGGFNCFNQWKSLQLLALWTVHSSCAWAEYFSGSCSGPSGEHGWYVDENTANLKYVVNMTGAVPPK